MIERDHGLFLGDLLATQNLDRYQSGFGGYLPLEMPVVRRDSPDSDRPGGMIATTS
jgi:hypothetical protein